MAAMPIIAAISCLSMLSGAEDPTTAKLNVVRKKAMVSISKAVLPRCFMTPTYIHMNTISPPMEKYTWLMCSSPRAMPSWKAVSNWNSVSAASDGPADINRVSDLLMAILLFFSSRLIGSSVISVAPVLRTSPYSISTGPLISPFLLARL